MLQTYARKTSEAIDNLTLKTNILKLKKNEIIEADVPENGLNIHGLYLQGASWNIQETKIKESVYGELWDEMPCLW